MKAESLLNRRTAGAVIVLTMGAMLGSVLFADPEKPQDPSRKAYKLIDAMRANAVKGEAMDEALGGKTLRGSPVTPRTDYCFPAEPRDLFWQMDMVPSGKNG